MIDSSCESVRNCVAAYSATPPFQTLAVASCLFTGLFFFYLSFFTLAYKQMRGPTFYFPPDFRHTLCTHTHTVRSYTHTHTGYELVRVDRGGHTSRRAARMWSSFAHFAFITGPEPFCRSAQRNPFVAIFFSFFFFRELKLMAKS